MLLIVDLCLQSGVGVALLRQMLKRINERSPHALGAVDSHAAGAYDTHDDYARGDTVQLAQLWLPLALSAKLPSAATATAFALEAGDASALLSTNSISLATCADFVLVLFHHLPRQPKNKNQNFCINRLPILCCDPPR